MPGVEETVAALRRLDASGELGRLCTSLGIDLLVLHGSARFTPQTAKDVDLAYLARDSDPVEVANTFGQVLPGDDLDLMPLHRADPVAAWAALGRGEVLVEATPGQFAEMRMRAFGEYRDTQKFRDLALSLVGS